MATRKELDAVMRKHGATLEAVKGLGIDYTLDAPNGYVWQSTGTHWVCITAGDERDRAEIERCYASLIRDMASGTEKCTEDDCEICEVTHNG